jgi:serine/threonine protein kinase
MLCSVAMADGSPQGAPIDRYVVLEYLAEGGMGAIYLGKKLGAGGFEKEVVLKQLLPEFTQQPEFIDLFLREARLSATLDHANIIHTIDLVNAGREYFIVMEYLAGADLRTLLKKAKRRRGRFSPAAGFLVAREVLSALAYAHNKVDSTGRPLRLIHRDVSPSNMLISHNGEVKLTDFGIAKASTHNSVFYRVKGKVGYMSPEQASNDVLDHRSDLYSLAVCLYEMITGERLFVVAGLTTSAEEIYSQPIPLVSRKVPGLPADIDKVMLKALSRDPEHRYQTAGEFQEALLRAAHRHGLMMSSPELADHLVALCGDPSRWRNLDGERASSAFGGGGTEIYDEHEGTEQLDVSEVSGPDEDLISVVHEDASGPVFADRRRRRGRAQTSITHLSRLQGIELTSMINIAGGADDAGARPLVDLDDLAGPARIATGASGEIPAVITDPDEDDDLGSPIGPPVASKRPGTDPSGLVSLAAEDTPVEEQGGEARAGRPWLILTAILLAGIGAAAAVGLSGPKLGAAEGVVPVTAPPTAPAPAPTAAAPDAATNAAPASRDAGTAGAPPDDAASAVPGR